VAVYGASAALAAVAVPEAAAAAVCDELVLAVEHAARHAVANVSAVRVSGTLVFILISDRH
jgi:hypothetical protein